MKQKKLLLAFFLISGGFIHAQEAIIPAGNDANGTGGSASYSVGQIAYTTNSGANGSVAQGVQQVYDISTTLGSELTSVNLELGVYPNPTTNYLQLKVENKKLESLTYQLIDLQGKVIEHKKVTANSITIKMETLPKAIYLLNVTDNNQLVKTFKIIKN